MLVAAYRQSCQRFAAFAPSLRSVAPAINQAMRNFSNGAVNNTPSLSTPLFQNKFQQDYLNKNPLTSTLGMRHGGVSILGCGLSMIAVGGCTQGIGQLFAALVVGIARNPSMKDDLFTYTLIGLAFVEFFTLVVLGFSVMLLYSE